MQKMNKINIYAENMVAAFREQASASLASQAWCWQHPKFIM